jgi:hypothetical protein
MRSGVAAFACVPAALWGVGCAASAPADPPHVVLRQRVCHAVVTAYYAGSRPSAVDVLVPAERRGAPPTRIVLTGEHVPLAEHCLGLPVPAPAASSPPAPAAPPSTPARAPALVPAPAPSSPLDTRS